MKKPKCKLCRSPHWTYEPHKFASNSASNSEGSAAEAGNQRGSSSAGRRPSTGAEATDKRLAPNEAFGDDERPEGDNVGSPSREVLAVIGVSSAAAPRKQRWNREDYNSYMKDYMRAYRRRSG